MHTFFFFYIPEKCITISNSEHTVYMKAIRQTCVSVCPKHAIRIDFLTCTIPYNWLTLLREDGCGKYLSPSGQSFSHNWNESFS